MFGTTNTGFPGATNFTNVSVTFSLQSTPDFADYPYRATYTNSAITSTAYASVTYSDEQATSGNFAPYCQTFDGGVYLYSKLGVGTISIPTISVGFYSSGLNIDSTVTPGSQALITSGAVANAIGQSGQWIYTSGYSSNIGTIITLYGEVRYIRVGAKRGILSLSLYVPSTSSGSFEITSLTQLGSLLGLSFKNPTSDQRCGNWCTFGDELDWQYGNYVCIYSTGGIQVGRYYTVGGSPGDWELRALTTKCVQMWNIPVEEN